jgi:hypothetical protein
MKTQIFSNAIYNRDRIKFLYELREVIIEPYYISQEKTGNKVIYGRANNSNEIRKFEYKRMSNIKILKGNKFSPIIPIIYRAN